MHNRGVVDIFVCGQKLVSVKLYVATAIHSGSAEIVAPIYDHKFGLFQGGIHPFNDSNVLCSNLAVSALSNFELNRHAFHQTLVPILGIENKIISNAYVIA